MGTGMLVCISMAHPHGGVADWELRLPPHQETGSCHLSPVQEKIQIENPKWPLLNAYHLCTIVKSKYPDVGTIISISIYVSTYLSVYLSLDPYLSINTYIFLNHLIRL